MRSRSGALHMGRVFVLLYHDVCTSVAAAQRRSCPRFTTPVSRLQRHLEIVRENRMIPIGFREWSAARSSGKEMHGDYVIFTFDGPHTGWFEYGIPLFKVEMVPAVFFITVGWVGSAHLYPESRHLTWDHIRMLQDAKTTAGERLFEIGNHSLQHSVLERDASESDLEFQRRLRAEIVEASHLLTTHTGEHVASFASPKGKGSLDVMQPYLTEVGIKIVRWASLPGKPCDIDVDFGDIQIAYCDMASFSDNYLGEVLGTARTQSSFCTRWLRAIRTVVGVGRAMPGEESGKTC